MTREEFKKRAAAGEVVLIDIREPFELTLAPNPAGAINIPMSRLAAAEAAGELPKDKLIVTLCQSGGRCFPVNEYLSARGYRVDAIDGGLVGWGR